MATTSLHRLHARLRAFARKPVRAHGKRQLAKTTETAGRDWRRDFESMDKLEAAEVAGIGAPTANTIGGVIIFGWQKFDASVSLNHALDEAASLKDVQKVGNAVLGLDTESGTHLSIAWRDAMVLHLGAEEYHRFLLERRKRMSHDT